MHKDGIAGAESGVLLPAERKQRASLSVATNNSSSAQALSSLFLFSSFSPRCAHLAFQEEAAPELMAADAGESSSLTALLAAIFLRASSSASPSTTPLSPGPLQPGSRPGGSADPAAALLSLIRRAQNHIDSLSLISDNDTLDDLPTSSLRAILLGSIYAQALARSQTQPGDFAARSSALRRSKEAYRAFLGQLLALSILDTRSAVPYVASLSKQSQSVISQDRAPFPDDASGRRAAKIAAMKLERGLLHALDDYRTGVRAKARTVTGAVRSTTSGIATPGSAGTSSEVPETSLDLLILPQRQRGSDTDDADEEESDREDDTFVGSSSQGAGENGVTTPRILRAYLVMLCHLHALQALSALDSTYTELQLLASIPQDHALEARQRAAREEAEARHRGGAEANDDWRIEQRWGASKSGPLMDDKGKPLRPFTILPGEGGQGASDGSSSGLGTVQAQVDQRQRLHEQVFRPSHRLPTMTMDEYLAEEERRGHIVRGGGQASAEAPTTKEVLALRSEGGAGASTFEADEADEEQRRKAIEWDTFSEANPKGMGNTMNRG